MYKIIHKTLVIKGLLKKIAQKKYKFYTFAG